MNMRDARKEWPATYGELYSELRKTLDEITRPSKVPIWRWIERRWRHWMFNRVLRNWCKKATL